MPKLIETVLIISVLGTEPYLGGLEDLSHATMEDDFSGAIRSTTHREVTDRAEQQDLCDEHGSDLAFFGEEFMEDDEDDA